MDQLAPPESMTDSELLREIAGNLRYLRHFLSEFEPLLTQLGGSGRVDAVTAAGIRRAFRKAACP